VLLLLGALAGYQQLWLGENFGDHPDEGGHFVTGMMVREYLGTAWGQHPVRFAEQYYARYPKVALGHWPPLYYALQTVWYSIFGPAVSSAHALNFALLGALLTAWILLLKPQTGLGLALSSAALLASLPSLQRVSASILSDLLVVLFCFLACHAYAGQRGYLAGLLAGLAILAKGNAFALLPAFGMATFMAHGWSFWRQRILWTSTGIALAVGAPFYLYAKFVGMSYPVDRISSASNWHVLLRRIALSQELFTAAPWPVWLFILLGFAVGVASWRNNERIFQVHACFALSSIAFLAVTGLSFEDRAALPLVISALAAAVAGISSLPLSVRPSIQLAGPAILTLLFLSHTPARVPPLRGFAAMAALAQENGKASVTLVDSDAAGEGAFIAHRTLTDRHSSNVSLRASRYLSSQTWGGENYRERFTSDEDTAHALSEAPVHFVFLDSASQTPHSQRLRRLSQHWKLLERRRASNRVLELYQIVENAEKPLRPLDIRLGPERGSRAIRFEPHR
jgi:hypothetical protein